MQVVLLMLVMNSAAGFILWYWLVVSITVWLTKTQPYSRVTVESNNVQFIISSFCLNTRLLFSVCWGGSVIICI